MMPSLNNLIIIKMDFRRSPMSQIVLALIFLAFSNLTEAQPTFLIHSCPNTTTYPPNSTYGTNLNKLLSSFISSAITTPTGFLNLTVGRSPDIVYGLFLCRGDVSIPLCGSCIEEASKQLKERCPVEKVSIIYFDECMLRYSDENFFSTVSQNPNFQLVNTVNVPDPFSFMGLLGETLQEASSKASNSQNGKKFGTEKANINGFQDLYTFAQCTVDLSASDCSRCLGLAVSMLLSKQGGRTVMPSCNVRFELYPFYNESNIPADPPENGALPSPAPGSDGKSWISSRVIIVIVVPICVVVVLVFVIFYFLRRRAKKSSDSIQEDNDIPTIESLQFNLATIKNATDKFSDANKLGRGGFGTVYKGTLLNGDQIAVKRLSKNSGQGAQEFKNEVVLLAKLQHKNLVRLLGFCCQEEEKILVYEYVSNKSLDYILFDSQNKGILDWSIRYKIIMGIARGILYLHEDSRLIIIHRDLKASNILLDGDLTPKISDFGMAKIFEVNQTQGNTNRIVGTYGYMSPEYAMHGQFSEKSDVYSFGVLVLEIISGKKNNGFYQREEVQYLLIYAWKHYSDGTPLEFLDPTLRDYYSREEVIRCFHLGLLCVQEDPTQRPSMATIVRLMNNNSISLPLPQQLAFMPSKTLVKDSRSEFSTSPSIPFSVNDVSVTELYPR